MWKWSDLKRLLRKAEVPDYSNYGAIMWPVVYDTNDPKYMPRDPHITVIYFGDVSGDIGFTAEDVIEAIKATRGYDNLMFVSVKQLSWFGEEQNIPVLEVEHTQLQQFYDDVKTELDKRGIPYDTTYTVYKPHVTITNAAALDGVYPLKMIAGPVELWWHGNRKFKMNAYS